MGGSVTDDASDDDSGYVSQPQMVGLEVEEEALVEEALWRWWASCRRKSSLLRQKALNSAKDKKDEEWLNDYEAS